MFKWLRKGLSPSVSMKSITEEDSNQSSSEARQVFPEDNPSVTVPVSEANATEEISAASTDDRQEEERAATPPTNQEEVVIEENVSVPDPPASQVEVENPEAPTNNTTGANDVVMTEDNVAPTVNTVHEANDAPATIVQPDALANASAPVPPPRPHTIEQAFYQGKLGTIRWPILVHRLLPDLSLIIMWSTGLRFRSQSQVCQGSQVMHLHQAHSM